MSGHEISAGSRTLFLYQTCYGTVHQEAVDGSGIQEVPAYRHKAYRYIRTGDGVKIEQAGLLYHDDEAMEELDKKIDFSIPWGKPGK